MEIMGLAVIVILLAVGMFFVAKFSLSKGKQAEEVTFQQRQIATGFVNTLLTTDAGCANSNANFARLIEELIEPEYSTLVCGTDTLEEYFISSVEDILNNTLDVWGYKYKLSIVFPERSNIMIEKGCEGTTQEEAAPIFPIPTDYGVIRVVMKICY